MRWECFEFPILEKPLLNLELADATFWRPYMIAVEKCNPMSPIFVCGGLKLARVVKVCARNSHQNYDRLNSEVQRIHNGRPSIKEGYIV